MAGTRRAQHRSLLLISCLVLAALSANADIDWKAYERGDLGLYPQVEYLSTARVSAPLVHVENLSKECDAGYVFLSPSGDRFEGQRAYILDSHGQLVWHLKEIGAVKSFQVQQYRGDPYLVYWVGDDKNCGHGRGYYKMLDQTYTLAYAISALNSLDADYHEFSITDNDTAIISAYVKTPVRLEALGGEIGFIWDSVFQEIDIEKNILLFEWRASDHFTFQDMAVNSWKDWLGTEQQPWDWFHLNSVQKDAKGNYLIAARYTNSVSYVDGKTGTPKWHLGGDKSSFTDLCQGNASAFVDPHMVRWTDDYRSITLFDNLDFQLKKDGGSKISHGLKIELDQDRMIAKNMTEFSHPKQLFAVSEGSVQRLENGNYFVGYGSVAVYSEFSPQGTLLCNTQYAPIQTIRDEAGKDFIGSYRIYKHRWTGYPKEKPDARFDINGTLHVSWNGATEVRFWRVAGRDSSSSGWVAIDTFPRTGFETAVSLGDDSFASYQLAALDFDKKLIRAWQVHAEGDISELFHDGPQSYFASHLPHAPPSRTSAGALLTISSLLLIWLNWRVFVSRKSVSVSMA